MFVSGMKTFPVNGQHGPTISGRPLVKSQNSGGRRSPGAQSIVNIAAGVPLAGLGSRPQMRRRTGMRKHDRDTFTHPPAATAARPIGYIASGIVGGRGAGGTRSGTYEGFFAGSRVGGRGSRRL